MKKYSQNNEQHIIFQTFRQRKGTFLDLGAFDGISLSNVRALAELGWQGVMVEASPFVFEKLKSNYEDFDKVQLCNMAVGATTGILDFHDNHHAVGTLHASETERWKGNQQFKTIEVPCMEINEFIDTVSTYKTFDFISCDIEGEDLNVIRRMDFDALKTRLICVEWNGKDKFLYDKILLPFGFKLIHKNGENLIYKR